MTRRPILLFPDPVLRQKTEEVTSFDAGLTRLVEELAEAMYAAPGVGLAAPQLGDLRRVTVIDLDPETPRSHLHVLVNPQIVEQSGAQSEIEGCLSIPGLTERVERPLALKVAARTVSGKPFELAAEGFLARVLCHEVDHLDGILFIDHLRGLRRQLALRKLGRLGYAKEPVTVASRR